MLNRQKVISQLDKVSRSLFLSFAKGQDIAQKVWAMVSQDDTLCSKVHAKKYSLLLPRWQGVLGAKKLLHQQDNEYTVLAVDGSQIYYDKHQGPACYLINVGSILLDYNTQHSTVQLASDPHVFVTTDEEVEDSSATFVNLQREAYEFEAALRLSKEQRAKNREKSYVTLFDGSLIFFHLDGQQQELKQKFLDIYLKYLYKFYEERILIAGYMSYPRTKELVNILKLVLADFDESQLKHSDVLDHMTDMDIASLFLQQGERSTVFESKAPISYLYPKEIKPYFCYLHVGFEIVRLEFPYWIAQDESLVDQVCSLAFDQAQKGHGYPVCLFEAHEQAVVKSIDRDFFYAMMQRLSQKYTVTGYQRSLKSFKKMQVPI